MGDTACEASLCSIRVVCSLISFAFRFVLWKHLGQFKVAVAASKQYSCQSRKSRKNIFNDDFITDRPAHQMYEKAFFYLNVVSLCRCEHYSMPLHVTTLKKSTAGCVYTKQSGHYIQVRITPRKLRKFVNRK